MLIGHNKIWQFLKSSYEMDKLAHGYLFFGEEGLGKKKLAKEFIKFLNCQSDKNKPCQICRQCRTIERGEFPDFSLIEPSKKEIQIDQIRDLKYSLSLKSYEGGYKAVIINEAQTLNQEAYSCLLKTLEEPLGKAIIILISQTKESLPKTILSRIEQIKFHRVSEKEIDDYLKSQNIPQNRLKEISFLSEGKPGTALNYLNNPAKMEEEKKIISDFIKLKEVSLAGRFQYIKDLTDDENKNSTEVLKTWLGFLRGLLLQRMGVIQKNQIYNDFYAEVNDFDLAKIKKILNICGDLNRLLTTTNASQKLAMETLMIEL